jgi:cytochrome P450
MTTMTFLTAGFESTNNLFTNLAYAPSLHPHIYREVKENRALVPALEEEGLRRGSSARRSGMSIFMTRPSPKGRKYCCISG